MKPEPSMMAVTLGLIGFLFGLYFIGTGLYGLIKVNLKVWPFGEIQGRPRFGRIAAAGTVLLGSPLATSRVSFLAALVGLLAYVICWTAIYGLITGKLGRWTRKASMGVLVAGLALSGLSMRMEEATPAVAAYLQAQAEEQAAIQKAKTDEEDAKRKAEEDAKRAAELESQYQAALKSAESGDCWVAGPMFATLGDYQDARVRFFECEYRLALEAIAAQQWIDAAILLEVVPDDFQPDVPELKAMVHQEAISTYWSLARDAKETQDYEVALAHLTQLKVLGDQEAETEIVEVSRLQAEAEAAMQAEAERFVAEAGAKPTNSSWDGSVSEVERFLKRNLKDPKSFDAIDWYKPVARLLDGKYAWAVRVRYRAKNSFGGYVIEDQTFYIQHSQVVYVESR